MSAKSHNLVVVGQGAAGLSAALSAAQRRALAACRSLSPWSKRRPRRKPAAIPAGRRPICGWRRPIASSRLRARHARRRPAFRATRPTSPGSPPTRRRPSRGSQAHGVEFHQPTYYLAKGPPRIQPVGGGESIYRELARPRPRRGRHVSLFAVRPERLVAEDAARSAKCSSHRATAARPSAADAVILACGGFQGEPR